MKYILLFLLLPCLAPAQSPEQEAAEILRERAAIGAAYDSLQAKADSIDVDTVLAQIEQAQQMLADLQALLFENLPVKWYIQPVATILPKRVFIIEKTNQK